jgi:hypothetical protein
MVSIHSTKFLEAHTFSGQNKLITLNFKDTVFWYSNYRGETDVSLNCGAVAFIGLLSVLG